MIKLVLFDLDDTLIVDEMANRQAVADLLSATVGLQHLNPNAFYERLISISSELLNSSPFKDYAMEMGISSYEIMWCNFDDKTFIEDERQLGEWSKTLKMETWEYLLKDHCVSKSISIQEIAVQFINTRRQLQRNFPETGKLFSILHKNYLLGLVTNGISSLQRQKIRDSSLGGYFDSIAVSSEIGFGKPSPRIFEHIISELGVRTNEVAMVGNNIERDISGARNAGLKPFLVNRASTQLIYNNGPYSIISSLSVLPSELHNLRSS